MLSVDFKMKVWYVHTDQMGIVHHSNYICYYEAARCALMNELGLSYSEMEARGIMMPIVDVHAKYIAPAYFDQELTIRTTLRELPTARITFHYEVFNPDGKLINEGSTTLGFMHADTRRPTRAPGWFMDLLREKYSI